MMMKESIRGVLICGAKESIFASWAVGLSQRIDWYTWIFWMDTENLGGGFEINKFKIGGVVFWL